MADNYAYFAGKPGAMDLGDVFSKAIEGYGEIQEQRQAEREELDKSNQAAINKIDEYQPGLSKSYNELVMQGAEAGRGRLLELNRLLKSGQISPSEYKMAQTAITDSWNTFSQFSKSYNGILEQQMKTLNEGKQSALGNYNMKKYSDLSKFGQLNWVMGEDNKFRLVNEKDGNVVDFQAAMMPDNFNPPKIDVVGETTKFSKTLADRVRVAGGVIYKSPLENPAFKTAKEGYVNAMLENPYAASSILADYLTGYDFYETDAQYNALPNKSKAIKLVPNEMGVLAPQLSEAQKKEAKGILNDLIDSQVEGQAAAPSALNPKPSKSSSSSSTKISDAQKIANRRQLINSMVLNPAEARNVAGNLSKSVGGFVTKVVPSTAGTGGTGDPNVDIYFIPEDPLRKGFAMQGAREQKTNRRSSQMFSIYNELLNSQSSTDWDIAAVYEGKVPPSYLQLKGGTATKEPGRYNNIGKK